MLLPFLAVALGLAAASPALRPVTSDDVTPEPLEPLGSLEVLEVLPEEKDSLNDIFREVQDLLKDSNSKLEKAVREMEAEEISADRVALNDLPPNYHNETVKETKIGNNTIITKEEINKETNNKTGSTFMSKTIVSSLQNGNKREHDCIVDEDCAPAGFCNLADVVYQCLPCKEQEACTRDGECCDGRLCVWGQCKKSEKGESGAICEGQSDCAPGLCCAVHPSLLYPVCTPLLVTGEECRNPNSLLHTFSWDMESDAPLNHCPCASGLLCRGQRDGPAFACEEVPASGKREETMDRPFLTFVPEEEIAYEDGNASPTALVPEYDIPGDEGDAADSGRQLVENI